MSIHFRSFSYLLGHLFIKDIICIHLAYIFCTFTFYSIFEPKHFLIIYNKKNLTLITIEDICICRRWGANSQISVRNWGHWFLTILEKDRPFNINTQLLYFVNWAFKYSETGCTNHTLKNHHPRLISWPFFLFYNLQNYSYLE